MELAVAQSVAAGTREQAQRDAQDDLRELRRQAIEAGRERSRKIIKVSIIHEATGTLRYNAAGRLLRDWYMHVYMNSLRANLGEPAVVIDAQQVEDLTALVHRVRPDSEPLRALHAVSAMRNVAVDDAAHAAAAIVERLRAVGAERAVRHAPDVRFDGDAVRVHVTRHWYLRCFAAHVEAATKSQQPLTAITPAEQNLVSQTLETRKIRRIIGRDGLPLFTERGTRANDVERALARGETGVVPAMVVTRATHDSSDTLRKQVRSTWSDLTVDRREQWLRLAGAGPLRAGAGWVTLDGEQQSKLIQNYLLSHRHELLDSNRELTVIHEAPAVAARRMFNSRENLVEVDRPAHGLDQNDQASVGQDLALERATARGRGVS